MESSAALRQLSALAQESRLGVFRRLVRAGPEGLPAGQIASGAGIPANTLSAQLGILCDAGLVTRRRDGRSIIYTANARTVSALILFLMEDCCEGRPEVCAPVFAAAELHGC